MHGSRTPHASTVARLCVVGLLCQAGVLAACTSTPAVPSSSSSGSAASEAFPTDPGRPLPDTLYGVTAESVEDLPALSDALAAHSRHPTVRLVFQPGEPPETYAPAVAELRRHSYLMGELVDSTATRDTSVTDYRERTRAYVDRFGDSIDIYEIGNELNGDWAGTPDDTSAKVRAAYDVVEQEHADEGLRTAITLNYWPRRDCYTHEWEDPAAYTAHLPAEVRDGVDYVFLSFYETACDPPARPGDDEFVAELTRLHALFPRARLGIGEVGAQNTGDGLASGPTLAEKQRIATRYYGLHPAARRALGRTYVGGYFWWYYAQDAVPRDRPDSLWPTLDALFTSY